MFANDCERLEYCSPPPYPRPVNPVLCYLNDGDIPVWIGDDITTARARNDAEWYELHRMVALNTLIAVHKL